MSVVNNINNHIKEEELFIVDALNSLGVPYTKDNTELKSFVELTVDSLIESKHPIFLYSCGGMNIRTYLKIKKDMHSTLEGQKYIANKVIQKMKEKHHKN